MEPPGRARPPRNSTPSAPGSSARAGAALKASAAISHHLIGRAYHPRSSSACKFGILLVYGKRLRDGHFLHERGEPPSWKEAGLEGHLPRFLLRRQDRRLGPQRLR